MTDQEGGVDGRRRGLDGVDELAEAGKAKGRRLAKQVEARNHVAKRQRGQRKPAIADHHAGHALADLHIHIRFGEQGVVVMGVHVDEARGDDMAADVDRLAAPPVGEIADRRNPVVTHRHVGAHARRAGAVDDRAAGQKQIARVRRHHPLPVVRAYRTRPARRCQAGRFNGAGGLPRRPAPVRLRACPPGETADGP